MSAKPKDAYSAPPHRIEALTLAWPTGLVACNKMAEQLGVRAERLRELADAALCPHYRIDGGEPMFKPGEMRTWAAANLLQKFNGQKLPLHVQLVSDPGPSLVTKPPAALNPCAHLLREMPFAKIPPSIYLLCFRDRVVYVGQSINPASRIPQHIGSKNFDRVYWIPVPRSHLDEIEAAFIQLLKPELNGTMPACDDPKGVLAEFGLLERHNIT